MKLLKPFVLPCLFLVFTQLGCTVNVRPTFSSSEFLSNENKIPTDVQLYVTEEFREYSYKETDVIDMKEWKLELGPATTDALRFILESHFENASVKLGEPQFPVELPDGSFVIVPTFVSVKQTGPVLVKFEKYHVTIMMDITIYDPKGKELKILELTGKGEKAGSIGYDSAGHAALPEASRMAIREIAEQLIQELTTMAK